VRACEEAHPKRRLAGRRSQRQWHGGWCRASRRQKDAAEDEAVVLVEDLSGEEAEADSAGPVKSGWYRRGKYCRQTDGGQGGGGQGWRDGGEYGVTGGSERK
jgi:hypothetical protein